MTRDQFIAAVAELMAGLQAPVSLGVPIGNARKAWTILHGALHGFGWAAPGQYEEEIRKVLLPAELRWAPYQEFGIGDPAAETHEPPAGPVTIGATGYRGNTIIAYWQKASS